MYKAKTNGTLTNESSSLILGRGNDIGQHINKDFLNSIQAIPFSLNMDMLELLSDTLKEPEEELTYFDKQDRIKAFNNLLQETDTVIDYLLENDNKFWFLWKYDKRGRSYSQGYHINPQGNAYRKAILEFHNKELLTPKGVHWLKIDIANCYGLDKEVWFSRTMSATRLLKDIFLDLRSWKRKTSEYMLKADSPELFAKAVYAYYHGVIKSEPIGHDMGLDASASGIQIMSAISGDVIGARNSNICPKEITTMTEEATLELEALEAELASL